MIKRLFGSNLTNNLVGIYLFKVTMETLFFLNFEQISHIEYPLLSLNKWMPTRWAICKPWHWNLGIGIGTGIGMETDITNVIISSSMRPMELKLSRVVT